MNNYYFSDLYRIKMLEWETIVVATIPVVRYKDSHSGILILYNPIFTQNPVRAFALQNVTPTFSS